MSMNTVEVTELYTLVFSEIIFYTLEDQEIGLRSINAGEFL